MFSFNTSRTATRSVLVFVVLALVATVLAGGSSPAAAEESAPPPGIVAVKPARLMDTRPGHATVDGYDAGRGPLTLGESRALSVARRGGVPNVGISAVVLNITATGATDNTYLTVFPTGSQRPVSSNINLGPGMTVANLAVSAVSLLGGVTIYNAEGRTDVIVDVVGFAPTGHFGAIPPARLLDTRPGQSTVDGTHAGGGPVGEGGRVPVAFGPRRGVPDATAAIVNITATDPTEPTYVTAVPLGAPLPGTSNLNPRPGAVTTNLAVIPLDGQGNFELYNDRGDVHLIADVVGFLRGAPSSFNLLTQSRVLDTRTDGGRVSSETRLLDVRGRAGVPTTGVGAVVLNLTAVESTMVTYITAHPSGTSRPLSSNLNPPVGETTANLVVVPVGPDGKIALYNAAGSVHLVADIVGWIGATTAPGIPDQYWRYFDPDGIFVLWQAPYAGSSPILGFELYLNKDGVTTLLCQLPADYPGCTVENRYLPGPLTVTIKTITAVGSSTMDVDPYAPYPPNRV